MQTELTPLYRNLEAAAIHGPGKHELVRQFNVFQRSASKGERIFTLTDSYGRVWIRPKDLKRACEALSLPAARCDIPDEYEV